MQTAHGRRTYGPGSSHWHIDFVSQPTWLLDNSVAIVFAPAGGSDAPEAWVVKNRGGGDEESTRATGSACDPDGAGSGSAHCRDLGGGRIGARLRASLV